MTDQLSGDCHIYIVYKDSQAGFDLQGEKTDLKNLLFSLMQEDPVFASICAIAVVDYCGGFNIKKPMLLNNIIELAEKEVKK